MDKPETLPSQPGRLSADSMIVNVRRDIVNRRFYLLLWGWYVFLAFLLQFFLKAVLGFGYSSVVWFGIFPVMAIMFIRLKNHPQESHTTYLGHSIRNLWTGVGISFFVLSLIIARAGSHASIVYPFFMLLYGLGTFVSGRLLKFRPLVAGGNFLLGVSGG